MEIVPKNKNKVKVVVTDKVDDPDVDNMDYERYVGMLMKILFIIDFKFQQSSNKSVKKNFIIESVKGNEEYEEGKDSTNIEKVELFEVEIPDSEGPFRLFANKSILENDKSDHFLGDKPKNEKNVQSRKKSGRISKQPQKGNN